MDLEAERAHTASSRRSDVGRIRHAVAWRPRTLTVATLVASVVVAVVGMNVASDDAERASTTASISAIGPAALESEESSATRAGDTPPVSDEAPTTTTAAHRTGAAASSSQPSPDSSEVEERGRRALDQIGYPWQDRLPGWTVEFDDGREGLFGLTLVDDKRIEIYVRDDQPDDLLVHIVAHELGHAVDVTMNSGADRQAWQAARGIEDEPWWPSSAASDFRTGAGDFAESFAYWQAESDNFRSKLGTKPTAVQLDLMAELAVG